MYMFLVLLADDIWPRQNMNRIVLSGRQSCVLRLYFLVSKCEQALPIAGNLPT
jgi:hypothetical protein